MEESPAQRAARIRRERREAKIKADPSTRMEKITGHRVVSESIAPVSVPSPSVEQVEEHGDPPEVALSEHHYYPNTSQRTTRASAAAANAGPPIPSMQDFFSGNAPSDADMQAMMAQHPLFRNAGGQGPVPGAGAGGMPGMPGMDGQGDPMLELMKKLGMDGSGGGIPGMEPPEAFPEESPAVAAIWQIVHLFAMVFIAVFSLRGFEWSGSLEDRLRIVGSEKTDLFYLFGATQLGLQGARFILEKGRLQGSGMLKFLAQILPQPWGGYVGTVARYNVIWATLMRDAMLLVFVLGVMAYLGA